MTENIILYDNMECQPKSIIIKNYESSDLLFHLNKYKIDIQYLLAFWQHDRCGAK